MIEIYTDGSSRGNPGEAGYGVVCFTDPRTVDICLTKQFDSATNNQMELRALIEAIQLCYSNYNLEDSVAIFSDSAYCVNMINDWIWKWKANDWKSSKKQTVENLELVKQLYKLLTPDFPIIKNFTVNKIKGHMNIIGNELADALATNNLIKFKKIIVDNELIYDL